MVKLRFIIIIVISCSLILADFDAGSHEPSDERGDSNYRRKTNIDINKIRATTFNYGLVGRTGNVEGEIPFEHHLDADSTDGFPGVHLSV